MAKLYSFKIAVGTFILSLSCLHNFAQSIIFGYTGAVQSYVVPAGVTGVTIDAQGAAGGASGFSRGGYGGRVRCTLAVTAGEVLNIYVGGSGLRSVGYGMKGGYNGGGISAGHAGSGGGATDIRTGGLSLSNRVIVAAGGGGGATNSPNADYDRGGNGGGLSGENGYSYLRNVDVMGGYGGLSVDWNTKVNYTSFENGKLGNGGDGYDDDGSCGGGGGGYYGGSGGGASTGSGGGGGSSYTDPLLTSSVIHTQGYNTEGDGRIFVTPVQPAVPVKLSPEASLTDEKGETQNAFRPHGVLNGELFSDFAYKAHADTLLEGRSGISQYAKVPAGVSMFQFRRVAIGYNYEMSQKFSAEFLLAAEDDYNTVYNQANGDLLTNNKLSPFIKLANLRWKNIFKGCDLVAGQLYTPAFHATSEDAWAYRSIARTLTHIYRTNEYDMGVSLQGHLPNNDNIGYNILVGNGTGATPENNSFKWFYGDVYHKFFDRKLIVDFYADYQKLTWTPTWHRDRQMNKIFVAYNFPKVTVGVEIFTNRLMGDDIATRTDGVTTDTLTTRRTAYSVFVRGKIVKDYLRYFVRFDKYSWKADNNNKIFESYDAQTAIYDHNTLQEFVTFGLDYAPVKNVHIMPNVFYNYYQNISPSSVGDGNRDFDLVYRLTFSYKFNN